MYSINIAQRIAQSNLVQVNTIMTTRGPGYKARAAILTRDGCNRRLSCWPQVEPNPGRGSSMGGEKINRDGQDGQDKKSKEVLMHQGVLFSSCFLFLSCLSCLSLLIPSHHGTNSFFRARHIQGKFPAARL